MKKAVKYKSAWYHDAYKALCNKITKILFTQNKIIILNQLRKIRETLNLCGNTNCWLNVPVKKHESTSVDFIKTDSGDVCDNQKIPELFNEYFSNIGPIL